MRKDGSLFPVEVSSRVIDDEGGWYAQAIVRDLTQRKRAEEERLQLERQLQQSQRLESLGVLAGGIAHDFNNILMAVLGNADLALDRAAPRLSRPGEPARDRDRRPDGPPSSAGRCSPTRAEATSSSSPST